MSNPVTAPCHDHNRHKSAFEVLACQPMSRHLEIDDGELRRDARGKTERFERLQSYLGLHKIPDPSEHSKMPQLFRVRLDHADREGITNMLVPG